MVGRRHFELRRTSGGDYVVELFGARYVAIDGRPADNGMPVKSGSTIRLGGKDGPSFRVEIGDSSSKVAWQASARFPSDDDVYETEAPRVGAPEDVKMLSRRRAKARISTAGLSPEAIERAPPPPPLSDQYERWSTAQRPYDRPPLCTASQSRGMSSVWVWALGAAAAMGAAFALWVLFRRDAALGAAAAKLMHAAVTPPPAAEAETPADLLDVSVFGPTDLRAGDECLIQVFLHQLNGAEMASSLALGADPEAKRRCSTTLAAEIARGKTVEIILEGRGLDVEDDRTTLVWRGNPCAGQFLVTAPADAAGRSFRPRVLVLVDSVPVGSLTFTLKISGERTSTTELLGDSAKRYAYAFLSYASPDRAEVVKRAQGLKAGGTDFFFDLLSLERGELWEQRLYKEIDRCDVFYLFWSSQAKASEWVAKETEYALARRAATAGRDPDIIPVIIEGPPPPSPPDALKDIHFNDSLVYVLAGIESASR